MATPVFLVVELAHEHANQVHVLADAASLVRQEGGEVYAHAPPGRVACLEPGTVASGLLIARFADRAQARGVAERVVVPRVARGVPGKATPLVLLADSLPDEGLPDMPFVPTRASVPRPAPGKHFFLLVRGTAWDPQRLDAYRDVILPMHFERGGYYESFAIGPGQVEPLAGTWSEAIFAISRWPTRAAAEDFWFCDRYQTEAIPLRLGAGRFTVHGLDAHGAR